MIGLLGFAAIWGTARFLSLPRWLYWMLTVQWWIVLILLSISQWRGTTDSFTPPPPFVGGDLRAWLSLGLLTAVVLAYRFALPRLRTLAQTARPAPDPGPTPPAAPFTQAELDRYARHILLRDIGGPGQRRLKAARVLVVGAGGLGAPVLLYLAGAGVGTIGVIDPDVVETTNFQRQVIHTDAHIGLPKVFSAERAMRALNPFITIRPYNRRLDATIAAQLVADYDLVIDGSDDFATRSLVNQTCVAAGVPLISGALTPWEGQVSLYHSAAGGPCYACVFPVQPAPDLMPACAEAGVVAPLPGVIGALMAVEAIKHLTGAGTPLIGRLMLYDALHTETRIIRTQRRPDCPVCGTGQTPP